MRKQCGLSSTITSADYFSDRWNLSSGQLVFWFAIVSLRIAFVPLWTLPYVPIVSPLYEEGHAWIRTRRHSIAIVVHVVAGSIALLAAGLQFDVHLRRRAKTAHRIVGYVYIVNGVACLAALQLLQNVVGSGKASPPQPSFALQTMVLFSSAVWLVAVALAVLNVRRGEIAAHKRWMKRALAALIVPITQRVIDHGFAQIVHPCVSVYLLVRTAVAESTLDPFRLFSETRLVTGERVLSFNAFGRVQTWVFGISAWGGILGNLMICERSIADGIEWDAMGRVPVWFKRPIYTHLLRLDSAVVEDIIGDSLEADRAEREARRAKAALRIAATESAQAEGGLDAAESGKDEGVEAEDAEEEDAAQMLLVTRSAS